MIAGYECGEFTTLLGVLLWCGLLLDVYVGVFVCFNETVTTEIDSLSQHYALPIVPPRR